MQANNDDDTSSEFSGGASGGASGVSPLYEKTLGVRKCFRGRVVSVDAIDVELPDGRRSVREVVRHPGAVAILARRPDGRFIFVRQYRKCIERAFIEIPAGCMEAGETPSAAALRELREESGYSVGRLLPLGPVYCCPGYSEELIHLFYAEVGADAGETDFDPDENIETLLYTKEEAEAAFRAGEIFDAKTYSGWLLWKLAGPAEYGA